MTFTLCAPVPREKFEALLAFRPYVDVWVGIDNSGYAPYAITEKFTSWDEYSAWYCKRAIKNI